MSTLLKRSMTLGTVLACLLFLPSVGWAQTHTGDVFGDLVHIKRDAVTGQPILQKRWVELPGDEFGWAYCPIAVNATGTELPFVELSCDIDPAYLDQVVPLDYFGRLSGGRTKERNQRMHFDEIILNIQFAEVVDLDEAGRLKLGSTCDPGGDCAVWKTVDSPMENLTLYRRLLKYGHVQTDPEEVDTSPGPPGEVVYHPALRAEDWPKFRGLTTHLLPRASASQCFTGAGAFVPDCAQAQSLTPADFVLASAVLGGAADKSGRITADLVQYLNRILQIPIATPESEPSVDTVPALIRDEFGVIAPATPGLPFPADERFVDFSVVSYLRTEWFDQAILVLQTTDSGLTWRPSTVQLLQWLAYANGPLDTTRTVMPGFIDAANDALRVVQFVHEYAIPANLWGTGTPTQTGPRGATVRYRASNQGVELSATVSATTPVNGGTVTFSVRTAQGDDVGSAVTSAPVVNGAAVATYDLPGGTVPQSLAIVAVYNGTPDFAPSAGYGSLVVGLADTTAVVDVSMMPVSTVPYAVAVTARVSWADSVPIGEGTFTFAVHDAAGTPVGTPMSVAVADGAATADYVIPGGLASQRLTTTATYSGSARFASSSGTNILSVGCLAVTIAPFVMPDGMVEQPFAVAITTDGVPPTSLAVSGALPPGLALTSALLSGTPTASGTFDFTLTATDAVGCAGSRTYSLRIDPSLNVLVTGPDAGVPGVVRHFEPNGVQTSGGEYAPFTFSWQGGVRVARGDLTSDGVPDTIVGAGPGGQPIVKAYNGASQGLIGSLMAFEPTYTGGVNVAVGDITGDGVVDVIAGASTGTPRVRVFNGRTGALMYDFVAFTLAGMSGVQVASGDFNADGLADLVVGAGPGTEPWVKVFDAATGGVTHNFLAYGAAFRGGVFVAAGDLNADGRADIVTGPGWGGGPLVRAFNGVSGAEIRSFWAYDQAFTGGVRVAASDLTADGHAEIVTAAGPGGPPHVKIFHGATNAVLQSFLAYPIEVTSGVYVAAPVRPLAAALARQVPAATVDGTSR